MMHRLHDSLVSSCIHTKLISSIAGDVRLFLPHCVFDVKIVILAPLLVLPLL